MSTRHPTTWTTKVEKRLTRLEVLVAVGVLLPKVGGPDPAQLTADAFRVLFG